MSKTILVMAITTTLILSTFAMADDAFAFIQPSETATITTQTGIATCTTTGGESCGVVTIQAKFRLLATETNGDIVSGVAQGQIKIIDDGVSTKSVLTLENDDPLRWSLETSPSGQELRIAGSLTANGRVISTYTLDAVGIVGEFNNGKATGEMSIQLNGNGFSIESPNLGIRVGDIGNDGDLDIAIGDQFVIKSIGSAICTTASDGECGAGLLKSKLQLRVDEVGETSASGVGKIKTVGSITDGWDFELEFRSKTLSYTYDLVGNRISVEGPVKANNGSTWQLEMLVEEIDLVDRTGVCSERYSNSLGDEIQQSQVLCRLVILPVES